MKKIVLGTIIGTTIGVTLGYLARMAQEKGYLEQISDEVNKFAFKAKKKIKNVADVAQNEAEYIQDRAGFEVNKGKKKIENLSNKEHSKK